MSVIGEILSEARRMGYVNFGPGLPDPSTFPLKDIREIVEEIREEHLNYGPYDGEEELIEEITRYLERKGIEDREVVVTGGAQEAIALLGLLLRGRGVRVSNPGYLEAITAFRVHGVFVVPGKLDRSGEVPEASDAYYVIPTGHNPTGKTMDLERREAFAQFAERSLLLEDGTYEDLYYERVPPPIATLTDRSVYIASFSKIVSPGLRIGFLALPEGMKDRAMRLRSALNICAPTVSQYIVLELLRRGIVERAAQRAREVYRAKRDAIVKELKKVLDVEVPRAGFFLWVTFHEDAVKLLAAARERGVVFIPGEGFFTRDPDPRAARISFSFEPLPRVREGAKILREIVERA